MKTIVITKHDNNNGSVRVEVSVDGVIVMNKTAHNDLEMRRIIETVNEMLKDSLQWW